jgi:hypothetical protein
MAKLNVPAEITTTIGLNYEATFRNASYSMEDALIEAIDAGKNSDKEYEADRAKSFPSFEAAAKAVMGRRIVVR